MTPDYFWLPNLPGEVVPPEQGILSRTVFQNDQQKVILFGFAAGEELSEHTASKPAILHFLSGEAELTLGEDQRKAQPGSWAWMPAGLKHSIRATQPTVLLLLLGK